MLSFLLTAATTGSYESPAALCPPCHPEDEPATVFGFFVSLLKSAVSLLVIVFPLYKTFKAWESNRLRACRTMLAYWSAMTLLNALKDITDELILNYLNVTLHHLIVAALKLAPLVLGPDKIYDLTVRSFFEHHEAEMDAMVMKGTDAAQGLKDRMEPTLEKMKEQVEKMEARVEPTIEQIRESLRESVDTVKSTLGMPTEPAEDAAEASQPHELSAEEALRRDEELTVEQDSSSKTGLRQRSAKVQSNSSSPTGVTPEAESEIEQAKLRNVLVEKIVWGHGLSAKNEEYQRQLKEKEAAQDSVVADVHTVANQFNTVPAAAPGVSETYNVTETSNVPTSNVTATPPPLPPRPVETTDAITITNSNTQTFQPAAATTTTTASAMAPLKPNLSTTTSGATMVPMTPTSVMDARSGAMTGSTGATTTTTKVLLDTRSIPNIVNTYAADYQKEL